MPLSGITRAKLPSWRFNSRCVYTHVAYDRRIFHLDIFILPKRLILILGYATNQKFETVDSVRDGFEERKGNLAFRESSCRKFFANSTNVFEERPN